MHAPTVPQRVFAPEPYAVGVVGSHEFQNTALVTAFVRALPHNTVVVVTASPRSRHWKRINKTIREAVQSRGGDLTLDHVVADWGLGFDALTIRDRDLAARCDRTVVFWSGDHSTRLTFEHVAASMKPTHLFVDTTPMAEVVGVAWECRHLPTPPSPSAIHSNASHPA